MSTANANLLDLVLDFDPSLCEGRLFEDDEVECLEEDDEWECFEKAFDPSYSYCKGDRYVEKSF